MAGGLHGDGGLHRDGGGEVLCVRIQCRSPFFLFVIERATKRRFFSVLSASLPLAFVARFRDLLCREKSFSNRLLQCLDKFSSGSSTDENADDEKRVSK